MGSTYNPLTAPGYVAGTLTITGGSPVFLLDLIKAQLEPQCGGAALLVTLSADSANTVSIFGGAPSKLGGALSAAMYGFELQPGGSHFNSSSGSGWSAPVADIQLFSVSNTTAHIEVYS